MTDLKDITLKHDLSEQDEITFADSDLFNLTPFAENLRYIFNFPMPLAIIIDGGWGTGKTVFATQLDNMMGNRSRYINVFAHDYQDDVFTALLLSVKQVVKPEGKFKELFTNALLHHIVPNLTNELIKKMTYEVVNLKQWTEEATNAYIENVENRRHMLDNFRSELKQHMEQEEKPVVILVDELDRCKPKYALQVLEIIKHLYSVPKIHFVLIMNTKQIIKTIRHEHGCNQREANIYLQKFYDLMIPLPNTDYSLGNDENISKNNIKKYINFKFNEIAEELRRHSPELIDSWEKTQTEFNLGFTDLVYRKNLNLREIDKIFLRINIIACYPSENPFNIYILASLLLIQLREPELFRKILNYYKNYDGNTKPYFGMNSEIRVFLSINLMQDDNARELWSRVFDSIWNIDATAVLESRYIYSLIDHIEYLTFLNSSIPSEE